MSRTAHARRHAHRWEFVARIPKLTPKGDRYYIAVYRCSHPGCFASKKGLNP